MYANGCGKVIHIDAKPSVRKQIVRELHIMHECHSSYIVSFYGAFLNEGDVVMCMEYMDCGLDPISPCRITTDGVSNVLYLLGHSIA